MKPLIFNCLAILCFGHVYGQQNFTVTGKVPQSLNGQKVELVLFDVSSGVSLGSDANVAIVSNGSFTIKGTMSKPYTVADILATDKKGNRWSVNVVLEAKENQFVAQEVYPNEKHFNNKFSKAGIVNSRPNYIHQQLDSVELALQDRNTKDNKQQLIQKEQLTLLMNYPNDDCSVFELDRISRHMGNKDLALKVFNSFSPSVKSSFLGKPFAAAMDKYSSTKVGMPAPLFSVATDKGKTFTNSSLKGSAYVIVFSATWCVPCQIVQKKMLVLYHKYRPQGLKVVYFNLDGNAVKWKKHIRENKLDWINVSEGVNWQDSKIASQYAVNAVPVYLIVDKQGKIIYNGPEMNDVYYNNLEEYISKGL
ncbi:AhpC/TSA family protein [Mucilaginibacter sp. HMF5004]|uniref:TlpA disulfide reductase family protein n=1 Tax=Mucilaginibacter rivuli TaxID=2857527 RepID=UPI001C5F98EE|nr:TlpA disulfide reductase family protein [Mucilaginibacter rivuli]MBW4889695.1 AhpC/TSA family protein [Mucilaginibacter rivuli]